MEKSKFTGMLQKAVLLCFILTFSLISCDGPEDNVSNEPVVRSISVIRNPADIGDAFQGEVSTLQFLITINGENIFPVDLLGGNIQIGRYAAGQLIPDENITIHQDTPRVTASGQPSPVKIVFNGLQTGTHNFAISFQGERAVFSIIARQTQVGSVAVTHDHGEVFGGVQNTLHYRMAITGTPTFPIDLRGPYIQFRLVTPQGLENLPEGIVVNPGSISLSNAASAPFSFLVNRPAGAVYRLVALVHDRPSAPFDLVVSPSSLAGEITISGTPAMANQRLETVTGRLSGIGTLSFQWQRALYPNSFNNEDLNADNIPGATNNFYDVQNNDAGYRIRVIVSREGFSGVVISSPTNTVPTSANESIFGTVTTTGNAEPEGTLNVNVSGLPGGAVHTIQWQRRWLGDLGFVDIPNANGNSYVVQHHDANFAIRAIVTAQGFNGYISSTPTSLVPARLVATHIDIVRNTTPLPQSLTINVTEANEQLEPQLLSFGGRQITITIRGGSGSSNILSLDGSGSMFTVGSGVTLILENIELRGISGNNSPLITVSGGSFVMGEDSKISGNINTSSSVFGGGVSVINSGEFILDGGNITQNRADEGGGVFVRDSVFEMQSGEILNNTANAGGGVYSQNAVFDMSGGNISDNTAVFGGGVMTQSDGIFEMTDGTIADNTASLRGGGVFVGVYGLFVKRDGEIIGNNAVNSGGGVFVSSSQLGDANRALFVMFNGLIDDNQSFQGGGVGIGQNGTFELRGGTVSGNRAVGAESSGGGVFASGAASPNTAFFFMFDGTVTENTSERVGGGITNHSQAQFAMFNGIISKNEAEVFAGGVFNTSAFFMLDGSISGNKAPQSGGMQNHGLFFMEGGIIHGLNADSELANTSPVGAVLITLAGGESLRGTLGAQGQIQPIALIHRENTSLNWTLHVENGLLLSPITATGMTVTEVPSNLIGSNMQLLLRAPDLPSSSENWDLLSGLVTERTGDSILFRWPTWSIPINSWAFSIEFWENNEITEVHEGTVTLELGHAATTPFSSFTASPPVPRVTSIVIPGVSTAYLNRNGIAEAMLAVGPTTGRWIGNPLPITASITIVPDFVIPPGTRQVLMAFFFPPGTQGPESIYESTRAFTSGANIVPFNQWNRAAGLPSGSLMPQQQTTQPQVIRPELFQLSQEQEPLMRLQQPAVEFEFFPPPMRNRFR
ncbi:MAG: hypothetical protein FWC97_05400 [Treponema sp.]|nr:hypothetical protein [Treponema sp.]